MITLFCISICWIGFWRVPRSALGLPVRINRAACASGVHCPVTILQSYLLNCAKVAIQTCWRQWFAATWLVSWIDPWLLWKPRMNCFSFYPHQIYKSLPYNRDLSAQDRISAQPSSSDPKSYKCFWLYITCKVTNSLLCLCWTSFPPCLQCNWVNEYHQKCREVVGAELERQGRHEALRWLLRETEPLGQVQ